MHFCRGLRVTFYLNVMHLACINIRLASIILKIKRRQGNRCKDEENKNMMHIPDHQIRQTPLVSSKHVRCKQLHFFGSVKMCIE